MSKFAAVAKPVVFSAVRSASEIPDILTAEDGAGHSRDAKSELFLLALTNMVGERTFYEGGKARDDRFQSLIGRVTMDDPDWIARFVPFLRDTMNMRSASLVMAAEYVHAGGPKGRAVIASALKRADEPAEMVGYWFGRYGKRLPQPVKRGIADAIGRLYNERAALKYNGDKGIRMADVIELVHPKPVAAWQGALFAYLLAHRHNRTRIDMESLPTIAERAALDAIPAEDRAARLGSGLPEGTTWEWASSWIGGKLDAAFWQAMVPNLGIFALVRNLRNFDDAGIDAETRALAIAKLTDPEAIAKSRMFPLRFYAAHRETATLHWAAALEAAIEHSLANVPALTGRTLILVDVSGSMHDTMSGRSKLQRAEAAAIFGAALASRAEKADLVAFNDTSWDVPFRKVGSILRLSSEIVAKVGGGTRTFDAVAKNLKPEHTRVVILTDEQAAGYYGDPAGLFGSRPVYTFNLAGYAAGHLPSGSGNRHTFGGLTDAGFVALSLLERGSDADWPF